MSPQEMIWAVAAVAGVIVRPFDWPEAVWAVTGAALLVLSGLLSPADVVGVKPGDAQRHRAVHTDHQRGSPGPGREGTFSFLQSRPNFVRSTFHSPLSHPRVMLPLATQICEPFEYILFA